MASSTEAALKLEIARLAGAINRHKSKQLGTAASKPASMQSVPIKSTHQRTDYSRTQSGHLIPDGRVYKPKISSRGRRTMNRNMTLNNSRDSHHFVSSSQAGPLMPNDRIYKPQTSSRGRHTMNRNMTLNNSRNSYQARRSESKRMKYSEKPCPRFTTTGTCSRGLTCIYQHDANKIAICWNFLQSNCPNNAETCNLSHDPTPERTPLCVHFANNGRCTRDKCPFPHVRVGPRQGVCRDFAVLGYCDKGLDCDMQHVRECPDFAEKGTCSTKGCKLPHVIRANRKRKMAPTATLPSTDTPNIDSANAGDASSFDATAHPQLVQAEAQPGDEYISLMFNESEDDDVVEEDGDDDESDEESSIHENDNEAYDDKPPSLGSG